MHERCSFGNVSTAFGCLRTHIQNTLRQCQKCLCDFYPSASTSSFGALWPITTQIFSLWNSTRKDYQLISSFALSVEQAPWGKELHEQQQLRFLPTPVETTVEEEMMPLELFKFTVLMKYTQKSLKISVLQALSANFF